MVSSTTCHGATNTQAVNSVTLEVARGLALCPRVWQVPVHSMDTNPVAVGCHSLPWRQFDIHMATLTPSTAPDPTWPVLKSEISQWLSLVLIRNSRDFTHHCALTEKYRKPAPLHVNIQPPHCSITTSCHYHNKLLNECPG